MDPKLVPSLPILSSRAHAAGFTLIELMITIAVVAILATLGSVSYRSQIIRTNRTEAKMALLRVQTGQEKFFLQNHRYADVAELAKTPPEGLGIPLTTEHGYYAVALTSADDVSYTATATAAGTQLDDEQCASFSIDNTGKRMATSRNAVDMTAACWK
jgi:type IV pilus assembly protein PilE